jgi:hypothetical protein
MVTDAGRRTLSRLHYFNVVRLQPTYALVVLAAIVATGVLTVWLNPAELDSGLGMVLLLQMFLASSGFIARARRGHFDPLLVHGSDRSLTIIAHAFVSALPGLLGWGVLATTGLVLGSPAALSAVAGHRAAAIVIVSAVAWAAGFALPRGGAGVLWIAALLALMLRHVELFAPNAGMPGTGLAELRQAATLVLCPFVLIGNATAIASEAVVSALWMTAVLVLSVCRLGRGLDVYLVDRA